MDGTCFRPLFLQTEMKKEKKERTKERKKAG